MNNDTPKITGGTIARTIILALALVNQVLTVTGHSVIPIADEEVNELVSLILTIGASIVAWWKNNSFTKAARFGDEAMDEYKFKENLIDTLMSKSFDDYDSEEED